MERKKGLIERIIGQAVAIIGPAIFVLIIIIPLFWIIEVIVNASI